MVILGTAKKHITTVTLGVLFFAFWALSALKHDVRLFINSTQHQISSLRRNLKFISGLDLVTQALLKEKSSRAKALLSDFLQNFQTVDAVGIFDTVSGELYAHSTKSSRLNELHMESIVQRGGINPTGVFLPDDFQFMHIFLYHEIVNYPRYIVIFAVDKRYIIKDFPYVSKFSYKDILNLDYKLSFAKLLKRNSFIIVVMLFLTIFAAILIRAFFDLSYTYVTRIRELAAGDPSAKKFKRSLIFAHKYQEINDAIDSFIKEKEKRLNNELAATIEKEKSMSIIKTSQELAHDARSYSYLVQELIHATESLMRREDIAVHLTVADKKELNDLKKSVLVHEKYYVDILNNLMNIDRPYNIGQIEEIMLNEIIECCAQEMKLISQVPVHFDIKILNKKNPFGDLFGITRVFRNVIKNCFEAAPYNETVYVNTRDCFNAVEIIIGNTGSYIEEEQLELIFEKFVTTKGISHGIGLSIVKNILIEHGTDIRAFSQIENGKPRTEFIFNLPLSFELGKSDLCT